MKSAFKRYKFWVFAFLALLLCVPMVVFGLEGATLTGYKITANTASNIIYPTGYSAQCITNVDSAHSYFIPTKTAAEFAAFKSHAPSAISFCLFCGDEICNNGETCSTCSGDCGSCTPDPICNNGVCETGESCSSCALDCGECSDCSLIIKSFLCNEEPNCIWVTGSGCQDRLIMQ